MKTLLLFGATCILSISSVNAQIVDIPDANFKAYLVGNSAINTNADTEIQASEAYGYTGEINCSLLNITDMTGISVFQSISALNCSNNHISSLNLTSNVMLDNVTCFNNLELTSLNINGIPGLDYLYCGATGLTTLDVSTNTDLKVLNCAGASLSYLDVTLNSQLLGLDCSNNMLPSINVSFCPSLNSLNVAGNWISVLNLSNNSGLTSLDCRWNDLSALNVGSLTNLQVLRCQNNTNLTSLDVSANPALIILECQANQLTTLNVANGNNANFSGFNATQNQLTCIQVDNAAWSTANWTNIDASASFDEDCGLGIKETELITSIYPNPVNDLLNIELTENSAVQIKNLVGDILITINAQKGINSVDISHLPSSVYLISVVGLSDKKFIKL